MNGSRRDIVKGFGAMPLVSLLCGLASSKVEAATSDSRLYGATDPQGRSGGTLTVGSLIEPPSLDIFHQAGEAVNFVAVLIYQSLTYADADGDVLPLLAERWEVSDDLKTYVFHLRAGVTFHTGEPLTAQDVKYSLDYIRTTANGAVGALDFADVSDVGIVGPLTLRVVLSTPNAGFPMTLAHRNASIIPNGWYAREGARSRLNKESAGTGPFRLAEFKSNSYIRLERNAKYWQPGLPYLDAITISFIPNSASLLVAARNRRVDLAVLVRPQDAAQLKGASNVAVQRSLSLKQGALDMDCNFGPFKDSRVREAVALLIDRAQVMQASISGYGQVLGTMVPGMQQRWGVPIDQLPNQKVDIARAKTLLAAAGHPDGFQVDLSTIIGYDWMDSAALVIAQQLAMGGIRVNIKRTELGTWLQNLRAKTMGLTLNEWGTPPDPNILFYRHFHRPPQGADFRNWNNATASELLDKGRATKVFEDRRKTYLAFQKVLAESVPTIMLFGADNLVAVNERVHNHVMHPTGWYFGLVKAWVNP